MIRTYYDPSQRVLVTVVVGQEEVASAYLGCSGSVGLMKELGDNPLHCNFRAMARTPNLTMVYMLGDVIYSCPETDPALFKQKVHKFIPSIPAVDGSQATLTLPEGVVTVVVPGNHELELFNAGMGVGHSAVDNVTANQRANLFVKNVNECDARFAVAGEDRILADLIGKGFLNPGSRRVNKVFCEAYFAHVTLISHGGTYAPVDLGIALDTSRIYLREQLEFLCHLNTALGVDGFSVMTFPFLPGMITAMQAAPNKKLLVHQRPGVTHGPRSLKGEIEKYNIEAQRDWLTATMASIVIPGYILSLIKSIPLDGNIHFHVYAIFRIFELLGITVFCAHEHNLLVSLNLDGSATICAGGGGAFDNRGEKKMGPSLPPGTVFSSLEMATHVVRTCSLEGGVRLEAVDATSCNTNSAPGAGAHVLQRFSKQLGESWQISAGAVTASAGLGSSGAPAPARSAATGLATAMISGFSSRFFKAEFYTLLAKRLHNMPNLGCVGLSLFTDPKFSKAIRKGYVSQSQLSSVLVAFVFLAESQNLESLNFAIQKLNQLQQDMLSKAHLLKQAFAYLSVVFQLLLAVKAHMEAAREPTFSGSLNHVLHLLLGRQGVDSGARPARLMLISSGMLGDAVDEQLEKVDFEGDHTSVRLSPEPPAAPASPLSPVRDRAGRSDGSAEETAYLLGRPGSMYNGVDELGSAEAKEAEVVVFPAELDVVPARSCLVVDESGIDEGFKRFNYLIQEFLKDRYWDDKSKFWFDILNRDPKLYRIWLILYLFAQASEEGRPMLLNSFARSSQDPKLQATLFAYSECVYPLSAAWNQMLGELVNVNGLLPGILLIDFYIETLRHFYLGDLKDLLREFEADILKHNKSQESACYHGYFFRAPVHFDDASIKGLFAKCLAHEGDSQSLLDECLTVSGFNGLELKDGEFVWGDERIAASVIGRLLLEYLKLAHVPAAPFVSPVLS